MASELAEKLRKRYELESDLAHLEQRRQFLEEAVLRGTYETREAEAAALEYEGFSLRSLLDKLSGKWEEKREALQHSVRRVKAELAAAKQELTQVRAEQDRILSQLQPLRGLGETVDLAETLEPRQREWILRLEARLATKTLIDALECNLAELESAQEWARPQSRIEAIPGQTKYQHLARADACAKQCCEALERIAACGILLEIHPYFTNPTGYISGVAAQYAQLDRINQALGGIRETRKQARELLVQLPEEENP